MKKTNIIKDAENMLIWECALHLVDNRTVGAKQWKMALEMLRRRVPGIKDEMRIVRALASKINIAKCEKCKRTKRFLPYNWPAGWTQCGGSKYGKRYQKSGLSWWCPKHGNPRAQAG